MESKEPLPETVQWLLDFANLGCIPGEPNPQRFKSYYTHTFQEYITNEHIPKLKRPPIELSSPEKEKDTFYKLSPDEQRERLEQEVKKLKPGESIVHKLPLHEIIKRFKNIKSTNHILHDGYEISISRTGEPVFHGKNIELFPLIVDFCSKKGILLEANCEHVFSHKKCNYSMAMTYWYIAQSFFNRVMQVNSREGVHPFVKMAFDYAKENKPAHKLSQWVSQCVWDFWDNQRGALQSRLRQCSCCGRFWFIENTKSKPRIYCPDKCNKAFHKQARKENSKASSASKKAKKDRKKKNDYNAIKEYYIKTGNSTKDAEDYANEWIYYESKTLENFKREHGKG